MTELRSPLRYPGGKARAVKLLLPYVPPHSEYREVFAGGASLFFRKPRVKNNWLNDIHPGLYAFYIALRDYYDDFAEICREQKGNLRKLFDYWASRTDLMELDGDDSVVERAVQFYFINRTVWSGRVIYDPKRKSRLYFSNPGGWLNLEKKLRHLRLISRKLQGVKITCLPFEECLNGARKETFIYCDPPYIRDTTCALTDRLYDREFPHSAHDRLARLLERTRAKVMLSYDDCRETRSLYSSENWRFVPLEWKYCGRYAMTRENKLKGMKERKVTGKELLIMNYEI